MGQPLTEYTEQEKARFKAEFAKRKNYQVVGTRDRDHVLPALWSATALRSQVTLRHVGDMLLSVPSPRSPGNS